MRCFERGSGETMACGTGACAAVVAAVENGWCAKNVDIQVQALGGNLLVRYTDDAVILTGKAELVYEATTEY
ncbi:MAG: diaminopimelate epimerase, partial [bacterium]